MKVRDLLKMAASKEKRAVDMFDENNLSFDERYTIFMNYLIFLDKEVEIVEKDEKDEQ